MGKASAMHSNKMEMVLATESHRKAQKGSVKICVNPWLIPKIEFHTRSKKWLNLIL